jgi:hypothetical protein
MLITRRNRVSIATIYRLMLTVSIVLFAVAMVVGLTIATRIFKNKNTPLPVTLTHGFFAASGLTLLIIYAAQQPKHSPLTSIVLFSIAVAGGLILFARDMMNKSLPKPLIIAHAGIAIISLVILLMAAFNK